MENNQYNESQGGSYNVCRGLTFPSHKCGFKE